MANNTLDGIVDGAGGIGRRAFLKQLSLGVAGLPLIGSSFSSPDVTYKNSYSPRNPHRDVRQSTEHIVLHTTEAGPRSSLNSVRRRGLANYLVNENGTIHRIVRHDKVAWHAGRSMWDGLTGLNDHSIGVEFVGEHDTRPTKDQLRSGEHLISELQGIYPRVRDEDVLPHSMVAYGTPNEWYSEDHRGRKGGCGMFFARSDIRDELGIGEAPSDDPDVEEGRLIVADKDLHRFLYGEAPSSSEPSASSVQTSSNIVSDENSPWDIAREHYSSPNTVYTFPDGTTRTGAQIDDWGRIPDGTKVSNHHHSYDVSPSFLTVEEDTRLWDMLEGGYDDSTTIYFLPDGRVRRGDQLGQSWLKNPELGTKVLPAYVYGGKVTEERNVGSIVDEYDRPGTLYYRDGAFHTGDEVEPRGIQPGTFVFFPDYR